MIQRSYISRAVFILTVIVMLTRGNRAHAATLEVLTEGAINRFSDLCKKFYSPEWGTFSFSVLPFIDTVGTYESGDLCKNVRKSLIANIGSSPLMRDTFPATSISVNAPNEVQGNGVVNLKGYGKTFFIRGAVHSIENGYSIKIDLVDPERDSIIMSDNIAVYRDDGIFDKSRQDGALMELSSSIDFKSSDSFLESPINVLAWLNDFYVKYRLYPFMNLKLGVTTLYLEMNEDLSLLASEVYPHFLSSGADGFRNFDPIRYSQFTQMMISRCLPFIGFDIKMKASKRAEIIFDFSTTLFLFNIPIDQVYAQNPLQSKYYSEIDMVSDSSSYNNSFQLNKNSYPSVMFRFEVRPRITLSENTSLELYVAFICTPLPPSYESLGTENTYSNMGDFSRNDLSVLQAIFPGTIIENGLAFLTGQERLLMGYSAGLSVRITF